MKKRNLPFILFLIFIVLAGFGWTVSTPENHSDTLPGTQKQQAGAQAEKPAATYLASIRNNQHTGLIDPADVIRAQEQINQMAGTRSENALNWTPIGPDNFGGRTRAIIFDNRDASGQTIYAGSVTGGLWKSVNGGITWHKINQSTANLYVSCMKQASNGDIYVGTGESFSTNMFTGLAQMGYKAGFMGKGIFKSTDGENFTLLNATAPALNNDQSDWAFVNELAIDDTKGRIYAATNTGLKFSDDGGATWAYAKDTSGADLALNSFDVQVGSDGVVAAAVNNLCYISTGATDAFVLRSVDDSISLPNKNIGRLELAIAPSDPNVIYASLADLNGETLGVYKSDDKGATWRVILPGGTNVEFFDGQGIYDNTIVVFPDNPNKVFIGGLDMWEGIQLDDNGFFFWKQISEHLSSPLFPEYLHADHHTYVFKPGSSNSFVIGTDGGVAEGVYTEGAYTFQTNNRNYFTTQFYGVGPSGLKKRVLGGAQDNGSILISGEGNTPEYGVNIYSGDGGPCAVSLIDPEVVFVTEPTNNDYRLAVHRSEDGGENYSTDAQFLDNGKVGNSNFKTPIALWESFYNENSRDSLMYYVRDTLAPGTSIKVQSSNRSHPFWYTTPSDRTLYPGDSIMVADRVSALMFIPVTNTIWMTWDALKFDQTPDWFTISNRDFGFEGSPYCISYSADANHIFVGTREGRLFRISNIALAYNYDRADVNSPGCIISTKEMILIDPETGEPNTQVVTSVSVDPQDPNNVLVTLGNYGNTNYLFFSTNALAEEPVFESRQGNLPQMPVYSCLIEMNDGNTAFIGTEYGVFSTQNLHDASPDWVMDRENMGSVPVFELKQQTVSKEYMQVKLVNGNEVIIIDYPGTNNYGSIYAASFGRGLFRADDYFLVGTDEHVFDEQSAQRGLKLYPNPVYTNATVEINLDADAQAVFNIFDLNGRLIRSQTEYLRKGSNQVNFDMSELQTGVYFVQFVSGKDIRTQKFIVK